MHIIASGDMRVWFNLSPMEALETGSQCIQKQTLETAHLNLSLKCLKMHQPAPNKSWGGNSGAASSSWMWLKQQVIYNRLPNPGALYNRDASSAPPAALALAKEQLYMCFELFLLFRMECRYI